MNIEQLKNRDYVLVLDKSGSMNTTDTRSGKSRWVEAKESTFAIATKLEEYDPDGIKVVPFSTNHKVYDNTTAAKVASIFAENDPMGSTFLAPPLNAIFSDYLARKKAGTTKANGEICLVITDGQPEDETEVARSIVNFTKQLDNGDSEYGISFIQVGKDAHARDFLKRLDDNLEKEGAKYDIVDTKTMEELENTSLNDALIASLTD